MKKQFIKSVGLESSYSTIKLKNGVLIVSYGKEALVNEEQAQDASDENVVCFYQTVYRGKPSVSTIIKDICDDIDTRAKDEIQNGFVYEDIPVYLSVENQLNFSSAYSIASIGYTFAPITLRLSTDNYKTFNSLDELRMFIIEYTEYIQYVLKKYWSIKDKLNTNDYMI